MKLIKTHQKLSFLVFAVSFTCLAILSLLSNPADNSSTILVFFGLLLLFIISLFSILLSFQSPLSPYRRQLVIVGGIYLTVLLMLKSARSLGIIDILVLLLTSGGLLFYLVKRS